mmetsp:Transcript_108690/g.350882  ORF Transcript_108690/g.350882 Transcript_108690/m.350882 type:complete len:248 (+) Transcript_108690:208-951(+)
MTEGRCELPLDMPDLRGELPSPWPNCSRKPPWPPNFWRKPAFDIDRRLERWVFGSARSKPPRDTASIDAPCSDALPSSKTEGDVGMSSVPMRKLPNAIMGELQPSLVARFLLSSSWSSSNSAVTCVNFEVSFAIFASASRSFVSKSTTSRCASSLLASKSASVASICATTRRKPLLSSSTCSSIVSSSSRIFVDFSACCVRFFTWPTSWRIARAVSLLIAANKAVRSLLSVVVSAPYCSKVSRHALT